MKPSFTFLFVFLCISISIGQTTDTLSGITTYRFHRFTSDYKYLLLNVNGNNNQTQKIYDTSKKEFVDWNDYPREDYGGHAKYNIYERYNRNQYLQRYLSTVKNTGTESKHMYDIDPHEPIISVPTRNFVRTMSDGSFLCKEDNKKGRTGQYYLLNVNGKKKKLTHKFPSKFKPPTEMDFTYDGKYGSFKRFYWRGNEHFQAFEIQNMITGEVLDFETLKDDTIIKIAYVTDDMILYESSSYYKIADWKGQELLTLSLSRMADGSPNRVLNVFTIDNFLYVIQQSGFQLGQEGGVRTRISMFDKNTGHKIRSKSFTSAVDIVPVKDNEFMVLYRDYKEHLEDNYDVNRYAGIGEGIAVEYIDDNFDLVEFKYLQNSTRKAERKRRQPPYPRWVYGIRKYQVLEHEGEYKMVVRKELFGFRLSDGIYIANADAEKQVKLANHIDPNLFLCDCLNNRCQGGYVQHTVTPSKKFDMKFVDYVTSDAGITYKKTTTFYASDSKSYSYETKCDRCNGRGFRICKDQVEK